MNFPWNHHASQWSQDERVQQTHNQVEVPDSATQHAQASERQYYTSYPQQPTYTDNDSNSKVRTSLLPLGHRQFGPDLRTHAPNLTSMSEDTTPISRSQRFKQRGFVGGPPPSQAIQFPEDNQWRYSESYQQRSEPVSMDQAPYLPEHVAAHQSPLALRIEHNFVRSQPVVEAATVFSKRVCASDQPHVQKPSVQQYVDAARSHPSVSTAPSMSNVTTHDRVASSAAPVDYQQLLLAIAEDYIAAAHGFGYLAALYRRQDDLNQYHSYVAAGLSCIETSLTQFHLDPHAEAHLTLRYCNLLFQETLNDADVDKWISKAILLCERHNFIDLKYAMQHLSTRALFVANPRLAVKTIDALIAGAQAYDHVPWVYALRFLRTSFFFELGTAQHEFASTVQNLKLISQLAARDDEAGVSLLSAVYEAMVHLQAARATCVEDSRRAIAAARSLQLHPLLKDLDQVWLMLDCVEIMANLLGSEPILAAQKAEQMASSLDDKRAPSGPNDDGVLHIPLQRDSKIPIASTCGIFDHIQGRDSLVLQWLPGHDLWGFSFLLNVIAAQARAFGDQKVEAYVREGLKITKENLNSLSVRKYDSSSISNPLSKTVHRINWWFNVQWCFQIFLTVNACGRTDWVQAQKALEEARSCPKIEVGVSTRSRQKWEVFLHATILQGMGHIDGALSMYQCELLRLPDRTVPKDQDLDLDLSLISTLNAILILAGSSGIAENNAVVLHKVAEPFISSHSNRSLRAAHELLQSVLHPQGKMIDKKKHFQNCLAAARTVNNTQLISIALSLMCTVFFTNVIGEQAQKSVNSTRALADRSRNLLWRSVAAGLQEHTALRHSKEQAASFAAREVEEMTAVLPSAVKANFLVD